MKIRLLFPWNMCKAGAILEPQPNVAGELIRRGIAEEVPDITVSENVPVMETACMEGAGETAMLPPPKKRRRGRPTNEERDAMAKAAATSGATA